MIFNNEGLYKLIIDEKILSYDGDKVKSYDSTTNQMFIQTKKNRIHIDGFLNKDYLKNLRLESIGENYLLKLKDIGDYLVLVDSLKLIRQIESIDSTNRLLIDNIQFNFLDSVSCNTFDIDIRDAMIFDMSHE